MLVLLLRFRRRRRFKSIAFGCRQDNRTTNTTCFLSVCDTTLAYLFFLFWARLYFFSCEVGCVLLNFQYKYCPILIFVKMSNLKLATPVAYCSCFLWCQHTAWCCEREAWMQRKERSKCVTSSVPAVLPVPPPLRIALNITSNDTHLSITHTKAHSTNKMVAITDPVSAASVRTYTTSEVPNNYDMCWVDWCASQYRYSAGCV